MPNNEQGGKSAFTNFVQQNAEAGVMETLIRIADNPLAMKIYCLIVYKMNRRNALIADYDFFVKYFGVSKSSVTRAVRFLRETGVLQVKRKKGTTLYLLNPNIVWKDKGNMVRYCEFEASVIFTEEEWGEDSEQ